MTLSEIRAMARKRPDQEFALNRLYGAHVSPLFTWICLRLGLSPDQVTILGGALGAAAVALLFLPIGWWSLVAVGLLQVGYILDFSDGQVARMLRRSSVAGSYLDWLTHFYVPVAMAFAVATSVAWSTGAMLVLVVGTLAALELAAFAFSCKEHVLIAMQRDRPALGSTAAFHAALQDDARPSDVAAAPEGPATGSQTGGIAGRVHGRTLRSLIGELLIYPGSVHLMTIAVVVDVLLASAAVDPWLSARVALLVLLALALPAHLWLAVRRNHRLIRALEARGRADG